MATIQETAQQMDEKRVWYAFWITHREFRNEASARMISQWLTDALFTVTANNLESAFNALEPLGKLARNAPKFVAPVPSVEVPAAVAAVVSEPVVVEEPEIDAEIPASFTPQKLKSCSSKEIQELVKIYGEPAVVTRYAR
jgi:hypothetical protein